MGRKWTAVVIVVATLAGLVAGSLLSGVAKALTETTFMYPTPQNGYLMLPAAAFTAASQSAQYQNDGWALGGGGASQSCFSAPINLPQGAKLVRMRIQYVRPASDDVLSLFLGRRNFAGGPFEPMLTGGTSVTPPMSAAETTFAYTVAASTRSIQNQTYSYMLNMCLQGASSFSAARLDYTYLSAGD